MAEYRTIRMSFWTDPYIENLSADGKLLYIYLFTCPLVNNLGVMETTVKRIAYETGIDAKRVTGLLAEMEKNGKLLRDGDHIWLTNFIKNQCSTSPKLLQSMKDMLQSVPSRKIRHALCLRYPHVFECSAEELRAEDTLSEKQDTLSIPYPYDTDTVGIPSGELRKGNMEIGNGKGEDFNAHAREATAKPERKKHGEFQNVLLTDEEYEKLCSHFGSATNAGQWIERLSGHIASKGDKYKNHYATILNWERRDGDERRQTAATVPRATTVAQQRSLERQMMAQMLLDDREQQKKEDALNAQGNRIAANSDGAQSSFPPGW